jgi:hypothetical protein
MQRLYFSSPSLISASDFWLETARVADHLNEYPDPSFYFNSFLDPNVYFFAGLDQDPAPHQTNKRPKKITKLS